ncbi:MAG: hypothetical protein ACTHW2_11065 [Tissierella sp.]|uniref:hypothetical protein n=1 Tax=Tissierella sp. TaxID=41274 RepID=UPI003F9955FD
MRKKLVRWSMNIVFYIIYFLILQYIENKLLPISPISNVIIIFVLIGINIPLSIFTTEKIFSIIEKGV